MRGKVRRRLKQQRGLADPGLAAEQHERAGNDAAAEHAIEFVDAGGEARVLFDLDIGVQLRRAGGAGERVAMSCDGSTTAFLRPFLDKRVPGAAVCAAAQPLRRLAAALLTHKHRRRA